MGGGVNPEEGAGDGIWTASTARPRRLDTTRGEGRRAFSKGAGRDSGRLRNVDKADGSVTRVRGSCADGVRADASGVRLSGQARACGARTRDAPEDEGVGEGVAAEALSSVDAARGLACGEEAGDGVVHAVEDPGVCVDEESAHRDVHAQTLDAVVEGRRVDRLQEGRASETRVLAQGDHAVVAVHREGEPLDRDADVVGERGEDLASLTRPAESFDPKLAPFWDLASVIVHMKPRSVPAWRRR